MNCPAIRRARAEDSPGPECLSGRSSTQERFRLTAIYIPSFRDQQSRTWRLWYDLEGEEHFTYGVEMSDWDRIVPFAED